MAVLGEYPGLSGEEVSQKTEIEKSILSRAIKKLLQRNLIERWVDTLDRRRQLLSLSGLGEEIYEQIVPVSLSYEKQLLACFNEAEKTQFSELVDRLSAHVKSLS